MIEHCPFCRQRMQELEMLREQNRFLLEQLVKIEQTRVPQIIVVKEEFVHNAKEAECYDRKNHSRI